MLDASCPNRHVWIIAILLSVGVVAGTMAMPSRTVAQNKSDMQKAKDKLREGQQLYNQEKYLEAAETFEQAYELSGRGELLYNIGSSYEKAGDLPQAEMYYQKYLEENPRAGNADEVLQTVISLQEKIAARASSVEITSAQEGRNVFIDGDQDPRCQTPCSVSLQPGEHTISIRAEGMRTTDKTLQVGESESKSVEVKLQPEINPGSLLVSTGGSGDVLQIEGQGEHSLPMEHPIELEPGSYQLAIQNPSGTNWTGDVQIEDSETTRLTIPMALMDEKSASSGTLRRGFAYGLLGASAALVGGSVIMGMQARNTHDRLATEQQRLGGVNSNLLQKGQSQKRTANILLSTGIGALLSGGGLFVWDLLGSSSDSPASTRPPTQ